MKLANHVENLLVCIVKRLHMDVINPNDGPKKFVSVVYERLI